MPLHDLPFRIVLEDSDTLRDPFRFHATAGLVLSVVLLRRCLTASAQRERRTGLLSKGDDGYKSRPGQL